MQSSSSSACASSKISKTFVGDVEDVVRVLTQACPLQDAELLWQTHLLYKPGGSLRSHRTHAAVSDDYSPPRCGESVDSSLRAEARRAIAI